MSNSRKDHVVRAIVNTEGITQYELADKLNYLPLSYRVRAEDEHNIYLDLLQKEPTIQGAVKAAECDLKATGLAFQVLGARLDVTGEAMISVPITDQEVSNAFDRVMAEHEEAITAILEEDIGVK